MQTFILILAAISFIFIVIDVVAMLKPSTQDVIPKGNVEKIHDGVLLVEKKPMGHIIVVKNVTLWRMKVIQSKQCEIKENGKRCTKTATTTCDRCKRLICDKHTREVAGFFNDKYIPYCPSCEERYEQEHMY